MNYKTEPAFFTAPFTYTGYTGIHKTLLYLLLLGIQLAVMGIMNDLAGILLIICTGSATVAASLLISSSENAPLSFDLHALLTGVLIGFFLPSDGGFIFSFTVAFMGYFLSWGVFGGKGYAWINPVMLAVCIAAVTKPDIFFQQVSIEQIRSSGSVFAAFENTGATHIGAEQSITAVLNSALLHSVGVTLPEGYINLFWIFPSKIPALRYNAIIILSSIVLLATRTVHKTLPFTFLTVYGLLVYLFAPAVQTGTYGGGDVLSALLTSGILFSAFFIIHDNGSLPRSWGGRFCSGIFAGALAFCITGPGVFPAGIPFAVTAAGCITPLIELIEQRYYRRKRGGQ